MTKILIPRIGGDIGQGIAKCLLKYDFTLQLIGVDRNPDCGWKAFVDYFVLEGKEDKAYPKAIKFPYEQKGGVAEICNNKLSLQRFLASKGIKGPLTFYDDEGILKPEIGHGSKGITRIPKCYIWQEKLIGEEITCPIYVTKTGEIRILQLERTLMGGMTGKAKVVDYDSITVLCYQVAHLLGFQGAFNIQLIFTDKGPRIFEINPRFSSTVYMRHLLGFKDVVWQLQELLHEPVDEYIKPATGKIVIRKQDAEVIS